MTFVAANPELERRAKAAFDAVVDLAPEERASAMHSLCGADPDLRQRLMSLLAAHDHTENFLDPPPPLFGFDLDGDAEIGPANDSDDPLIGQRIARYRVVRRIGAGGMGMVYLAEQDQPRRRVALKVMRASLVSRSLLRRFEHEAEVLGQLRHVGIAQVLEAGTFDLGRGPQPYFAMEFIDGQTLTEFIRTGQLDVRQRLELLTMVCDAVHHAHQKGVVHRDLKPDNILVPEPMDGSGSACPNPKVLDFGVARLTNADIAAATLQTEMGQIVGTLPYMSPEQVAGDPAQVDIRSDVYALGVIAFEALTGSVPLDVRRMSVAEAARVIADHEPPSLTSFDRVFRGDLSTIVGKALEKDKARRYQSAWELAEDLRRFLRHEPISARPATTMYQLRKFARRNKVLVAGAAGILLMLVLGIVGTSIGMLRARESARIAGAHERAAKASATDALRQRATAEQTSAFLQQMLASVNPSNSLGRDTALLREILDVAAQRVAAEFHDQPDIAATMHGVIGRTYASIAQYDRAIEHLRLALEGRRAQSGENSAELAQSAGDLGRALVDASRFQEAFPLLEEAVAISQRIHGPRHPATARALNDLGNQRKHVGDYQDAEQLLRESHDILAHARSETDASRLRAAHDLAAVLHTRRKFSEARPLYERVLEIRNRTLSTDSPEVAITESNLSLVLKELNDLDGALRHIERAVAIYRKILPPGHDSLATALQSLASIRYQRSEYDHAGEVMDEALRTVRATFGDEHPAVARALFAQANLMTARSDVQAGEDLCIRALEMRRRTLPSDHPEIAMSLRQLAGLRFRAGKREEAAALTRESLEIFRVQGAGDFLACETLVNLATYEYQNRNLAEAERLYREALDRMISLLGEQHPSVGGAWNRLAKTLEEQRRFEEALVLRRRGLENARAQPLPDLNGLSADLRTVGSLLLRMQRWQDAETALRESLAVFDQWAPAERLAQERLAPVNSSDPTQRPAVAHFARARILFELGLALTMLEQYAEAETSLLESERVHSAMYPGQPNAQAVQRRLADLYQAWGKSDAAAEWERKSGQRRRVPKSASGS